MTGISEILVLILLITGILILPRMFKPAPKTSAKQSGPRSLGMKMRAGIVASILYPLICTLIMPPSQENIILLLSIGLLPVVVAWALTWILAGKKQ